MSTREEDHKKMRKMKAVYVCGECGCPDIEYKVWVHGNTDEIIGDSVESLWCPCCEEHGEAACLTDTTTHICGSHKDCKTKINWDWWKDE